MQQTSWTPDVLPGFEQSTLTGGAAFDGPADAVLVRRRCHSAGTEAVLYVHGYVDYFFQTHLADFYNQAGLHFYALDLRRHGRAMRERQLPNFTCSIDDYLEDVDAAVHVLKTSEAVDWLLLNGHSTGGLVAALYAHRGGQRAAVNALFLNSPFLDMNLPPWQERWLEPVLAALGAWWPTLVIPVSTTVYGQSLHAGHHGEWHYNTMWKPIAGFPVYAGWFRAIHRAHAEVARGLSMTCPMLVMHARRSSWLKAWTPDAMRTDVVLDVADMQRLAPKLGRQVKLVAIEDGMHDLVLSQAAVRAKVFAELKAWLVALS